MSDCRLTFPLAYLPAGLSSEVFDCSIAAICGMGSKGHGNCCLVIAGIAADATAWTWGIVATFVGIERD